MAGCWRPVPATLECRGADLGALLASLASPAQLPASVLAIARSGFDGQQRNALDGIARARVPSPHSWHAALPRERNCFAST